MSAEHIYPVADKAARTVDPMLLAGALDHIARTAHKSRSQTRRIRWIAKRAELALQGEHYADSAFDLPKSAGPDTVERLKKKADHLARMNRELLASLQALVDLEPDNSADFDGEPEKYAAARAAIAKAAGASA